MKNHAWVDARGVAHSFRTYEQGSDLFGRSGTTWCEIPLDLSMHSLRRTPATCMTCLVAAARQ